LFEAFAALPPPEPPSAALLSRIRGEIQADLARVPERVVVRERPAVVAVAVGVAFVLASVLSKHQDVTTTRWTAALLVAAFAALLATLSGKRASVTLFASIAASVGFSLYAQAGEGMSAGIGVRCALFEVAVALAPLGASAYLALAGGPRGALTFAAVGAAGGLAGHAALHVHCPVHSAYPHLLAFHLGGVVLAALLGAALSRLPGLGQGAGSGAGSAGV
jgi:branched-subunit amino acid transport protein